MANREYWFSLQINKQSKEKEGFILSELNIHWYPGHMAKTGRLIKENLKLVDVIIEVLDARIPISSRNSEISEIVGNKPLIMILNKSDLADDKITGSWINNLGSKGIKAIATDARSGKGMANLKSAILEAVSERIENSLKKGIANRSARAMITGIPNSGKSSLINRLVGKAAAITGDRPGVTRGRQWLRTDSNIELLDMPGMLKPKYEDRITGLYLAFTGAVKDDVYETELAAALLLLKLLLEYPRNLIQRYTIDIDKVLSDINKTTTNIIDLDKVFTDIKETGMKTIINITDLINISEGTYASIRNKRIDIFRKLYSENYEGCINAGLILLDYIGRKRGMLLGGNNTDTKRASIMVLDEFRAGKTGKITLERPDASLV